MYVHFYREVRSGVVKLKFIDYVLLFFKIVFW